MLVGMRRQAADGVALRVDPHVAAVDADPLGTIDQAASERAFGLVADEHHMRAAAIQAMAEVVQDAAGIGHAASRQ